MKRAYQQTARAEQAGANVQKILDSTVEQLRKATRLDHITLDDIAQNAGVTVRTILRRFGTRDGLLQAALLELHSQVKSRRLPTPPGDIDAGIRSLMGHYEEDGDFNLRALAQEQEFPEVHDALKKARVHHRSWLTEIFGPHLTKLKPAAREQRITELYAATDVYLWKLLRRDFHLTLQQTTESIRNMALAVLHRPERMKI